MAVSRHRQSDRVEAGTSQQEQPRQRREQRVQFRDIDEGEVYRHSGHDSLDVDEEDLNITVDGNDQVTPERRHSSLVGSLQATEVRQSDRRDGQGRIIREAGEAEASGPGPR